MWFALQRSRHLELPRPPVHDGVHPLYRPRDLAAAAPVMQRDLRLGNIALGLAFSAFNYSYAPFQLVGGWIADRFGARRTLGVCGLAWSIMTMATGAVCGLGSLFAMRLVLGMGEGATLPAATGRHAPILHGRPSVTRLSSVVAAS